MKSIRILFACVLASFASVALVRAEAKDGKKSESACCAKPEKKDEKKCCAADAKACCAKPEVKEEKK